MDNTDEDVVIKGGCCSTMNCCGPECNCAAKQQRMQRLKLNSNINNNNKKNKNKNNNNSEDEDEDDLKNNNYSNIRRKRDSLGGGDDRQYPPTDEDEEDILGTIKTTPHSHSSSSSPLLKDNGGGGGEVGHSRKNSTTSSSNGGGSTTPKVCCSNCCKESRANGRACLCQVPANQRRGKLGDNGCVTCNCNGCHPQDVADNSSTTTTSSNISTKNGSAEDDEAHPLKNGCCRACMKAFSETGKACLCQVPSSVRLGVLPEGGCKICRCKGCHPEESFSSRSKNAYRIPHHHQSMQRHPAAHLYETERGHPYGGHPMYMTPPPPPSYRGGGGGGRSRHPVGHEGLLPYPPYDYPEAMAPPPYMVAPMHPWEEHEHYLANDPYALDRSTRRPPHERRYPSRDRTPYDRRPSSPDYQRSSSTSSSSSYLSSSSLYDRKPTTSRGYSGGYSEHRGRERDRDYSPKRRDDDY